MEYIYQKEISISPGNVKIYGDLIIPVKSDVVTPFVHGSGSWFSKRNREVAVFLQKYNFGTHLVDLLMVEEYMHDDNRFIVDLLTTRLKECPISAIVIHLCIQK